LGHYAEGKSARDYQCLFQTLARKGYVVLAYDPFGQGERQQYLDPLTGRSRYGPTVEHDKAGWPLLLLGSTLAQYRVWDGIRALDYLASRPEVDADRIGCVGHSGGATMTMYLCALEPRIQVAVEVEGHTRNFAGPHYIPPGAIGDAEQNLVGSMPLGLDRGDLLWAFAPKPLLLIYTTHVALERPSYVEAVEEIFEEVKTAYRILGAEEKVRLFAAFLPHEFDLFNRRETYGWFNRWLAGKDLGVDEAEFESSPAGALNCTSTGQVLTSLGGRSIVQVNRDRATLLKSRGPLGAPALGANAIQDRVRGNLRALLALPSNRFPLDARLLSSDDRAGVTIEEFEFRSEEQIRVPGWFMKPSQKRSRFPVILYVTKNGKDSAVGEENGLEAVVRRGFGLCVIGLRGQDETLPSFPAPGPRWYDEGGGKLLRDDYAWASLIIGKPVLGQQVWDFLRTLDYLESRPDVDLTRLMVFGEAAGGLVAVLGSVLDPRPLSILCARMLADFYSLVESEEYTAELSWLVPGILRNLDMPDLIAVLAPRKCTLVNTVGPTGEILSESLLHTRFQIAIDSYSAVAPGQLRFVVHPTEATSEILLDGLENSLGSGLMGGPMEQPFRNRTHSWLEREVGRGGKWRK
jgi:dienelactone hydrolase